MAVTFIFSHLLLDAKAPAKWLNKVASKNDSFSRAHEDPFVMIKQEENRVSTVPERTS